MRYLSFKIYLILILSSLLSTFPYSSSLCRSESDALLYGLWKTENHQAKILISACPKDPLLLCGTIVETKESQNKDNPGEKKDDLNPEESLRNRKIIGLMNLEGFEKDPNNSSDWIKGTIYNPLEGKTYSCKLTVVDSNTLRVHGYVGLPIFGKTQIWTRSTPEEKLGTSTEN